MIEGEILHYRILEPIGEGGMGIVVKALDTHLDRPVAIKAIHERLLSDSRAKARLRREAFAAASIDHPFICKVYELIEHDGQTLVVMEYVEGESLHAAMQRGPLSISDALRYMGEVAEALGEIHRKGMVHRDIKPSNIMITPQRHAKLMDFGIVRSVEPPDQEGATLLTVAGGFVGTPRYMAPEQAAGDPADARSDVFSLGVVMFASLSGELPFEGESTGQYLRSALTHPAKDLRGLSSDIPEDLVQIVEKCLNKEPSQRFDSAAQLADALAGVSRNWAAGRRPRGPELSGRRLIFATALAALGLILILWAVWEPLRGPAGPNRFVAAESVLVTWPSEERDGQISPDGQWVSFLSDRGGKRYGLWLAPLSGGEPRSVTGENDPAVISHIWSPDSRKLAVLATSGEQRLLRIVPAFGGPPQLVHPLKEWERLDPRLVLWAGQSIYLQMNQHLWRFEMETSTVQRVNSLDLIFVDVRDDEKKILYTPKDDEQRIWMADIDGANPVCLTPDGMAEYYGRWIDQQRYLFLSSRTGQMDVWESNAFSKKPAPHRIASTNLQIGDVSPDGRVVLLSRVFENADLWCMNRQTGMRRQLTAQTTSDYWATLSGDGTLLAFQRSKPAQEAGNRLIDAQIILAQALPCGFESERVVVDSGFGPLLSPDGRWLAYIKPLLGESTLELWVQNLADQSQRRVCPQLALGTFKFFPFDQLPARVMWAASSSELYFVAQHADNTQQIVAWRPESNDSSPRIVARFESKEAVGGLTVADSGNGLYSVVGGPGRLWRVLLHDLTDGSAKEVYRDSDADELFMPGRPLDDQTIVLLRAFDNIDRSEQRIEALTLGPNGQTKLVGTIDRAFGGTARLDARSGTLYLTRIEGLAHNIYSFSFATGKLLQLTDNEFQGRTFCSLTLSPEGHLMYAQQVLNKEVVVVRLAEAG